MGGQTGEWMALLHRMENDNSRCASGEMNGADDRTGSDDEADPQEGKKVASVEDFANRWRRWMWHWNRLGETMLDMPAESLDSSQIIGYLKKTNRASSTLNGACSSPTDQRRLNFVATGSSR